MRCGEQAAAPNDDTGRWLGALGATEWAAIGELILGVRSMRHGSLGLLIGATLTFAGCGQREVTFQERVLAHPNPTAYEFEAGVSDVKRAIQESYDGWHFGTSKAYTAKVWQGDGDAVSKRVHSRALQLVGHEVLLWKGDGDSITKGLLIKPGNENDAYLLGMEAPYGESQVYFGGATPLIYYANFHIHLAPVASGKTRVEITTYDCKVAAGVDRRFFPVSSGPGLFVVAVAPTTVEEYQILLRISEKLGTKNMPPLVAPGHDSAVRQLTKPTRP